jgi:hypothetical protein
MVLLPALFSPTTTSPTTCRMNASVNLNRISLSSLTPCPFFCKYISGQDTYFALQNLPTIWDDFLKMRKE